MIILENHEYRIRIQNNVWLICTVNSPYSTEILYQEEINNICLFILTVALDSTNSIDLEKMESNSILDYQSYKISNETLIKYTKSFGYKTLTIPYIKHKKLIILSLSEDIHNTLKNKDIKWPNIVDIQQ